MKYCVLISYIKNELENKTKNEYKQKNNIYKIDHSRILL